MLLKLINDLIINIRASFTTVNWTSEVILWILNLAVTGIFLIFLQYYLSKKKYHYLFMLTLHFYAKFLSTIIQILKILLLSKTWAIIHTFASTFEYFTLIFLIDSISRESIEPIKAILIGSLASLLIFTAFLPNNIIITTLETGELTVASAGFAAYIVFAFIFIITFIWIYYIMRIHLNAPKNLKYYSRIVLLSVILPPIVNLILGYGLIIIIPETTAIVLIISNLFAVISYIIVSYIFVIKPQLANILPYKVLRLTIIDTNRGIALFNHVWNKMDDYVDEVLFSGMLQGISRILEEALKSGSVREINLDKGIVILQKSKQFPIACVLIASNSSRALRNALNSFSERFFHDFSQYFHDTTNLQNFDAASKLILDYFSFIPIYEEPNI